LLGKSNFRPSSSVITFIQGIYNYISQTDHVSTVYNFAAVLWLQCIVYIMILPMLYTALSNEYFLKYVQSAQYGHFL
jgi:membrane protein YdbS with pleckstrin-like domain